jgi:pyruvate dehydrogenase E1 component
MFGFQRVGDAIWAAADQRSRGFLLGATSGRTTLGGEGLQHQDGSSHLVAATIPNCKAYDPAFAGEMAVIIDHGMREMLVDQQDVFYYVTLMNENYAQPDLPEGAAEGVIRGGYRFATYGKGAPRVTLMGSGAILTEVIKAAEQLAAQGVASEVVSVTSWSELARDGVGCEQRAIAAVTPASSPATPAKAGAQSALDSRLRGNDEGASSPVTPAKAGAQGALDSRLRGNDEAYVAKLLSSAAGPVIAASDYVRAVPESVRAYVPAGRRYLTLGTDGFGRSDTRAALREFFGVDAAHIVRTALYALAL